MSQSTAAAQSGATETQWRTGGRVSGDPYPTRVEERLSPLERREPVVWGGAAQGPLDAATLGQFESRGFLTFERLLSGDELAAVLAEVRRLRAEPALRGHEEAIVEPGGGDLRSLFAVHKHSQVLSRLCRHPRVVAVAQQILGSEVYIHQSRVNYKPGFRGRDFYWHSDFETWHAEDGVPAMRMVSCFVSLTENTPTNGPLMIIPGSHRRFIPCRGVTPRDHYRQSLQRQERGVPHDEALADLVEAGGIELLTGPAGTVTFFDCNLMHGSNSNITPQPRSNLFVVFNSVENLPVAPFCGRPPRPWFLAEREDFTPV